MARFKIDLRASAFRSVLGFTLTHWRRQPWRLSLIMGGFLLSTLADVLTPLYSGRLVDAVASSAGADAIAWNAAMTAFSMLDRPGSYRRRTAQPGLHGDRRTDAEDDGRHRPDAFHRVQRFSTDWHANTFAGSTVRKVTRGMWALDLLNDTHPHRAVPVARDAGRHLDPARPDLAADGRGHRASARCSIIGLTAMLSVGYVSPAATLANAWDTRMGGALADAICCNAVVKGFGAEDARGAPPRHGRRQMARAHAAHLEARHPQWRRKGAMLLVCAPPSSASRSCCGRQGVASAGDIALVLTSFFVLQGYLRDIGKHVRNLQRSVNDMEELVDVQSEPLGIEDRPGAKPVRIEQGRVGFDHVTFHYGKHTTPLYRDFSVDIAPGERVGLVGHSGSGKTTFVKLIQRLYDVNAGPILIDGHDIREVTQASLRSQIAIVQQEPILFHRSLAENIAYARPGDAGRDRSRPRGSRARTTSSPACPRATRRWWASAASNCRAASASASPSRGPSLPMRRS